MLDGMRDGAAVTLFASFLSLFAAVSLSNLTPRTSIADFNCRYDGAYGTRKFKVLKYYKA
ncbi:MAG: hypothetical protein ACFNUU_06475 [Campylobacter sp.]|uniref:hypothetical protein n=1 Tax=Campylobacter sp. TaxID=205 RepID=UPI00361BF130